MTPQVSKDDRSDIESSSDEDDSPAPIQKHHSSTANGTNKSHGTNGYLTAAPYPDEHWLNSCLWSRATDAIHQTVCEWVSVTVETRAASPVWKFKIYINAVLLLVPFFTNFLFIYLFALSKLPKLTGTSHCLASEWKYFTLWCKHATLTYSSLADWGLFSLFVALHVIYFSKRFCRW